MTSLMNDDAGQALRGLGWQLRTCSVVDPKRLLSDMVTVVSFAHDLLVVLDRIEAAIPRIDAA